MFTRRTMTLATGAAFALAPAAADAAARAARADAFVTVDATGFRIGGRRHPVVVANHRWDAEGADGSARRLDALAAMGVTTVRLFDGSGHTQADEASLRRLDLLLAEMKARGLRAVIPLANFWDRSGGTAAYLRWTSGGPRPDPIPYHDHVRALVGRTSTVTGVAYARDPTIMAWRLADRRRPDAGGSIAPTDLPAYYGWIRDAADLVRRLAPDHLISTGGEGLKACLEQTICGATTPLRIDYVTAQVWPLSWSGLNADDVDVAMPEVERLVGDHIARHRAIARRLNRPLVTERFDLPRALAAA